ncbi:MAG TPA: hypothetical protein VGG25_20365 [Streptosporangiaceae bacterium]
MAGSRQVRVTAWLVHHSAVPGDRARARPTCAAASGVTAAGRPSASSPAFSFRAADRTAICAIAANSRACANAATRRHPAATAGRS